MPSAIQLSQFRWINPPARYSLAEDTLTLHTGPETDFWQRTYYGFRHDNAHAFVIPVIEQQFSFTVQVRWNPQKLFDQCGVVLYQDADNWFKASVEYDNDGIARLGSVVTNLGYSDWATTDVSSSIHSMAYRVSRRGPDFLIENSEDSQEFRQMRIFHIHKALETVNIGVYACSPLQSSMEVVFSHFSFGECVWAEFENPEA